MAKYARNHVCTLFSARVHLRQCPLWPATMHPPLLCKIIWNKKGNSQADEGNLLFQLTCTNFKWASHYKGKLEMRNYIFILLVTRACVPSHLRVFTRYI